MTELKFRFTYDILFKMLFVKYPNLLKRLISAIMDISVEHITEFVITNPEIPPESIGGKFCKLDINMIVNNDKINIEVQVDDEGDYPERSLYYWARNYSSALKAGEPYSSLPRVIIISIVDFNMFDGKEYRSEFLPLEINRREILSDRMKMLYFELLKLPWDIDIKNELALMLSLFKAKTEDDLRSLEALGVKYLNQAIEAYREVVVSSEFNEAQRLREDALHNEASALQNAERKARNKADLYWQGIVADKEAKIADKETQMADKDAKIAEKETQIADKDAKIADMDAKFTDMYAKFTDMDAEIQRLRAIVKSFIDLNK